jgi:hypothetical protein
MTIEIVTRLLAAGLIVWMALLFALLVRSALRGDVHGHGLLCHRPGEPVAPERALHITVFPVVLLIYVMEALHADVTGAHPSLPDIPQSLLVALTGTNSLFIAGKIARRNGGTGT